METEPVKVLIGFAFGVVLSLFTPRIVDAVKSAWKIAGGLWREFIDSCKYPFHAYSIKEAAGFQLIGENDGLSHVDAVEVRDLLVEQCGEGWVAESLLSFSLAATVSRVIFWKWQDYEHEISKLQEKIVVDDDYIKRLEVIAKYYYLGNDNDAPGNPFGRSGFEFGQTDDLLKKFKTDLRGFVSKAVRLDTDGEPETESETG